MKRSKVYCSHKMNTTNFICKDPDTGERMIIPVIKNHKVLIDIRIAKAYSSTFTIMPMLEAKWTKELERDLADIKVQAAQDGHSDDIKDIPDDGPWIDSKPFDDAIDGEDVKEKIDAVIEEAVLPEEQVEPSDEVLPEEKDIEEASDVIELTSDQKSDLVVAIDGFKNKKKLDDFAETLGVKLDRRKKLTEMKEKLKTALELN